MATEDKFWFPPLPPKDQQKLDQLRSKGKKSTSNWTSREFAGRSLWEWMGLLAILAGVYVTALSSIGTSWETFQVAALQEQAINVQEQATTLHTYTDQISQLVLDKNLDASKPNDIVQKVARVKTLTALRELDATHKALLLRLLYELGLITVNNVKVDLSNADLSGADLHGFDLSNVDLHGTILSNANLSNVDLSGADLSRTQVMNKQLNQAKSLKGATMPDGSIHP